MTAIVHLLPAARTSSARRGVALALSLVLVSPVLAACGAGDAIDVAVSGSSTVEPISALVAQRLVRNVDDVAITVDGPGTGDGFERFCDDAIDVADASRPIKDPEREDCATAGVEFVELQVAIDGLSVVVSPGNDFVECLDFHDLYALIGPESEGFGRWSDANELAAEIGAASAPYPDESLVITAPGEESGTFDSFVEIVLEDIAEERGQEPTTRPDYTASPNDNVIVQGVSGDDSALGWLGYAFFEENADQVRAVPIDGGEGCVEPTPETIADGSYPISRPLFIYVNLERAAASPGVVAFVDLYLSDTGHQLVADSGYVPLAEDARREVRRTWAAVRPAPGTEDVR